jgi:hypothetical protein
MLETSHKFAMECNMDLNDQASSNSNDTTIQDSTSSDEETVYELLFYSDVDDEEEETEAFLKLLVSAAAFEGDERESFRVRDRMAWEAYY